MLYNSKMMTFKEFLQLDEAGASNPVTQAGGNYGRMFNNPYQYHGGRYGRQVTADLTRPDQLLYHIGRLLDDVERMVHYRQNLPSNAPVPAADIQAEFSPQNIQILMRLGVLQQVGQDYQVNEPQIRHLQQEMLEAQKDERIRNWFHHTVGPLFSGAIDQMLTPRLALHHTMAPVG